MIDRWMCTNILLASPFLGGNEALSNSDSIDLSNGPIRLVLSVNDSGVPLIGSAAWETDENIIWDDDTSASDQPWLPEGFEPVPGAVPSWELVEHPVFLRAEATVELTNELRATRVVDLPKKGTFFRTHVRMANAGNEPVAVEWFPILHAKWRIPGFSRWIRTWKALSFERIQEPLSEHEVFSIGSRLHSSDRRPMGHLPHWVLEGEGGRMFFGLEWCGGWRADLQSAPGSLQFKVMLPPEETQLTLNPDESIEGPVLTVTVVADKDEMNARTSWMKQRMALAESLYETPAPQFPLAYNHWYAVRWDFDDGFLVRQIENMAPYRFDAFVIDAGWYPKPGRWEPDPEKFAAGVFEKRMEELQSAGAKVGIWSCPQFQHANSEDLPPEVDRPPYYREFIDAYLLDLAGTDFRTSLLDHVSMLRSRYSADWWKYDQDFFVAETRHGAMKNVVALQKALKAVRKTHPDLYIEDCQSGGRMINDFTTSISQTHWIADGGGTGLERTRANLKEALGALDLLPPSKVLRWINNPDRADSGDRESTKAYCRSAMLGVWGISADLGKIDRQQRETIVRETKHYRRLNELKTACRYALFPACAGARAAGVVYFNSDATQAGVVLLRWDSEEAFDFVVDLEHLWSGLDYRVEDVDTGSVTESDGREIVEEGLTIPFDEARKSAVVLVNPRS